MDLPILEIYLGKVGFMGRNAFKRSYFTSLVDSFKPHSI